MRGTSFRGPSGEIRAAYDRSRGSEPSARSDRGRIVAAPGGVGWRSRSGGANRRPFMISGLQAHTLVGAGAIGACTQNNLLLTWHSAPQRRRRQLKSIAASPGSSRLRGAPDVDPHDTVKFTHIADNGFVGSICRYYGVVSDNSITLVSGDRFDMPILARDSLKNRITMSCQRPTARSDACASAGRSHPFA